MRRFVLRAAIVLIGAAAADARSADPPARRTWCNPLDIEYLYNFENIDDGVSYRSGADPVIVNHQGEYYLFLTLAGGWWHSKDLATWEFVQPSRWPLVGIVAPAAGSRGVRAASSPQTSARHDLRRGGSGR